MLGVDDRPLGLLKSVGLEDKWPQLERWMQSTLAERWQDRTRASPGPDFHVMGKREQLEALKQHVHGQVQWNIDMALDAGMAQGRRANTNATNPFDAQREVRFLGLCDEERTRLMQALDRVVRTPAPAASWLQQAHLTIVARACSTADPRGAA